MSTRVYERTFTVEELRAAGIGQERIEELKREQDARRAREFFSRPLPDVRSILLCPRTGELAVWCACPLHVPTPEAGGDD